MLAKISILPHPYSYITYDFKGLRGNDSKVKIAQ